MLQQPQLWPVTAELLGDLKPLIEQLGSADGLTALTDTASSLTAGQINNAGDLRIFLQNYYTQILQPLELPAIQRAFLHASRNELRELIAFDQQLETDAAKHNFANASRRVGQIQLQRLRPLRDHRLVQRYLAAVEKNEAHGWHTLVYGLTLAVYSLPLRQGLCGYAQQTTRGFIHAASGALQLSTAECNDLLAELSGNVPVAVEALLAQSVGA